MEKWKSFLLAAVCGLALANLFAGCSYNPPRSGFEPGEHPRTDAIFCDVEATARCASSDDIRIGIDLGRPFEDGFWVGKSSVIGLEFSQAAAAACNGGPRAHVFRDAFPNGTPVCMAPGRVPGHYATSQEACQTWCSVQGFIDTDGNPYGCRFISWRADGVPDAAGFANACTNAGTLRADFKDPRTLPPPVIWTNVVGASVTPDTSVTPSPNDLRKTAANGWGNSGAISVQQLASGDGAVLVSASETDRLRIFGLGNGDASQSFEDLEFGLLMTQAGTLLVLESGAILNGGAPVGTYVTGDRLEVGVEGGVVHYRKNGGNLFTSPTTPTFPLLVDTAFNLTGATLTNVRVTF